MALDGAMVLARQAEQTSIDSDNNSTASAGKLVARTLCTLAGRLAQDPPDGRSASMVRGARDLPQDVPTATGSFGKRLQVSIIVPLRDVGNSRRGRTALRGRGKHHRTAHQDHRQSKDF
jgi:hypothetical protein